MSSSFSIRLKVGVVTFFALGILFVGTLWVKQYNPASSRMRFTVVFDNGHGIAGGDPVTISGIKVGEVRGVSLTDDNRAALDVMITGSFNLPDDCVFTIEDVGLMGDKALAIIPGTSSKQIDESKVYYGSESMGLSSIMASSAKVLERLNSIAEKIDGDLDIKRLMESFEQTTGKLQTALAMYEKMADENREPLKKSITNFEKASQDVRSFIRDNDPKLVKAIESFQGTTEKISVAIEKFNKLSTVIDTLSVYMDSGDGSLARLIKSDDLYEELRKTNASIDSFVTDFKLNPGKYTKDMQFKIRLF